MSAGGVTPLRHPTGIAGLDQIMLGGLPAERPTLLSGTAGSGKTVFALQFLAEGVRQFDEPGVFVTFEESTGDLRQSGASLGSTSANGRTKVGGYSSTRRPCQRRTTWSSAATISALS